MNPTANQRQYLFSDTRIKAINKPPRAPPVKAIRDKRIVYRIAKRDVDYVVGSEFSYHLELPVQRIGKRVFPNKGKDA